MIALRQESIRNLSPVRKRVPARITAPRILGVSSGVSWLLIRVRRRAEWCRVGMTEPSQLHIVCDCVPRRKLMLQSPSGEWISVGRSHNLRLFCLALTMVTVVLSERWVPGNMGDGDQGCPPRWGWACFLPCPDCAQWDGTGRNRTSPNVTPPHSQVAATTRRTGA